ncbi:MAG: Uma2 family endonuclease, partial [Deltaproteobacteria bacterium]|nr:Uma2 family endonuclease [Deltaproteobacteria bacterium]
MNGAAPGLALRLQTVPDGWELEDGFRMPESRSQDQSIVVLVSVLERHVVRQGAGFAARNMALRWRPDAPQVGVDPDVMLLPEEPPDAELLRSIRTWMPGHHPPRVAFEVVSEGTAEKDYGVGPAKYADSGTREAWIFDPLRLGPAEPVVLQVYRRTKRGRFPRVYAGDGPAWSEELGAWLVVTDGGQRLRLADDREGCSLWPTALEVER